MISNRCHYALRAMLELALREGQGPVPVGTIAQEQKIPARFLEAIMRQLKQAGLADSMRGKDGGYFLARPAREIHVGQIVSLFDGPLFTESEQKDPTEIREESPDIFLDVWREATSAVQEVFSRYSLARLAELEERRRAAAADNYAI